MDGQIQRAEQDRIDVSGLVRRSWDLFAAKPLEHVVASLIVVVLGGLTLGLLMGPLCVGQIRMVEKQLRGENVQIADVFSGFESFGAAFLTSFIAFVAILLGMLLLLLPGLFLMFAWGFALWFVALRRASSFQALSESWSLFKQQAGSVVVVLLLVTVANAAAGLVAFATLLSIPLSVIFATLAFEEMLSAPRKALGTNV